MIELLAAPPRNQKQQDAALAHPGWNPRLGVQL